MDLKSLWTTPFALYIVFTEQGELIQISYIWKVRASCAAAAACRETWQMVTRACPQCGGAYKPESVKQTSHLLFLFCFYNISA